jgi:hypothetical protein
MPERAEEVRLPFKIEVSEVCPPDAVYLLDPSAMRVLGPTPLDDILAAIDGKTIVCGSEKLADELREAANRVAVARLSDPEEESDQDG